MSGSSLHPSVLHGFSMSIHVSITSLLLLPKKQHTFPHSSDVWTMQTEPKMLLVSNCASNLVSYWCRVSAPFPHLPTSEPWCTDHHTQNAMTAYWTWNIYFPYIQLPKFCCLLEKTSYGLCWRDLEYNWIADCSHCTFFLIRNMTIWLFNDFICIYSFQSLPL